MDVITAGDAAAVPEPLFIALIFSIRDMKSLLTIGAPASVPFAACCPCGLLLPLVVAAILFATFGAGRDLEGEEVLPLTVALPPSAMPLVRVLLSHLLFPPLAELAFHLEVAPNVL